MELIIFMFQQITMGYMKNMDDCDFGRPSIAEIWELMRKLEKRPDVAWIRVELHNDTEMDVWCFAFPFRCLHEVGRSKMLPKSFPFCYLVLSIFSINRLQDRAGQCIIFVRLALRGLRRGSGANTFAGRTTSSISFQGLLSRHAIPVDVLCVCIRGLHQC